MRKKEYCRWDYDDENDMNMEEHHLTLEDNDYDHGPETPTSTTTFAQTNLTLSGSHIQRKKGHNRPRIKEKAQIICFSTAILLLGFVIGFHTGTRDANNKNLNTSKENQSKYLMETNSVTLENNLYASDSSSGGSSQETIENPVQPPTEISGSNIRKILKRMGEKVEGTEEGKGKSMSLAIRDLWRSYGLSVRVEQHKTLLTKPTGANYAEVLGRNGSVLFRTVDDDLSSPHYRPIIAFSPSADLNGTLVYGHYGRPEDWDFLKNSRIILNRSIALIRFGGPHPSKVANVAASYGIKGLLFYPDPQDYGPHLPSFAIRQSSLLTLGQIHEYQKHKSKLIPAHTISCSDAEYVLRSARQENWMKRAPLEWQGGLKTTYFLGPVLSSNPISPVQIRLRVFNEPKSSTIYNVVAAIPGAWESDRYVIIGCSHDSWSYGGGEPGIGLGLLTELARSFSDAVQRGWKPRRSLLFISWDANLFASSGVSHWLQEHHFEISSRTIAYIDLSRILRGNETLHVHSSPILREVMRKAISQVITSADSSSQFNPLENWGKRNGTPIYFSSLLTSDEPSFAFLGNLGIPFIRICLSNTPKGYDYPLFLTKFDTFENFVNSVDPSMKGAETLGKIILETIVLLADSSVLPINVEDYVVEIQTAFGNFMSHYQEDFHRANLSIAFLQAAVMRLEVIGDNFRTEMHNRTVINPEYDALPPSPSPSPQTIKSKKALLHRIINDKLMEIDRTFLSRSSDVYKHQVLGFTSDMEEISINGSSISKNLSPSLDHYFPKLREALDCGRRIQQMEEQEPGIKEIRDISLRRGGREIKRRDIKSRRTRSHETHERKLKIREPDAKGIDLFDTSICHDWHPELPAQRIASLTRALDAASAVLQSPLLPEESE